jgi:FlaA1/EpsC-like NDP-sugar epimerase
MEKVIIFGASLGGLRALRSLPRGRRAIAFCDNDRAKHGTNFHDLPVIAPGEVASTAHDRVLIASTYYTEIFNQLVDLDVTVERIDILDSDILNGVDEPSFPSWIVASGLAVVMVLVACGLGYLIAG